MRSIRFNRRAVGPCRLVTALYDILRAIPELGGNYIRDVLLFSKIGLYLHWDRNNGWACWQGMEYQGEEVEDIDEEGLLD